MQLVRWQFEEIVVMLISLLTILACHLGRREDLLCDCVYEIRLGCMEKWVGEWF